MIVLDSALLDVLIPVAEIVEELVVVPVEQIALMNVAKVVLDNARLIVEILAQ